MQLNIENLFIEISRAYFTRLSAITGGSFACLQAEHMKGVSGPRESCEPRLTVTATSHYMLFFDSHSKGNRSIVKPLRIQQ